MVTVWRRKPLFATYGSHTRLENICGRLLRARQLESFGGPGKDEVSSFLAEKLNRLPNLNIFFPWAFFYIMKVSGFI